MKTCTAFGSHVYHKTIFICQISKVVVAVNILDYANDSILIIATQRPRGSVPVTETTTLKEPKEAFEKSNFQQYWINKTQESIFDEKTSTYSNVHGHFRKDEYLRKRKEFSLPIALELKTK
jgi:hypothetical protein